MVHFALNAVGAPKSNVGILWVGIRWFLKNVCADVTLYIFYYFCIQEIHGLVR